jgi:hypothetical protein
VEGADALGLIAEVGIAIAGFAGVVATLRAAGGTMGAFAAFRIGILLAISAEAVLLALLPFAFHFAGLTSATIWAVSSSVMTMLLVTHWVATLRSARTAVPAVAEYRPPGMEFVRVAYIVSTTSNIVLQLANVALFRQLWPFYLGLLVLTAYSLFVFAYILFAPSRAEVPA